MPIRINLLSEALAAEDQRRRDPVKRVILAGIIAVILVLVWSSSIFVKTMVAKSELSGLESEIESRNNSYKQILDNQKQLTETRAKLMLLNQLTTNRFLVGTLLNTMQQTTLDNIQLTRLQLTHSYAVTDEIKPKPSDKTTGKPATATEKIVLTLYARDTSPSAGDGISKYQSVLDSAPYFRTMLTPNAFRLVRTEPPSIDSDGKTFVFFTLEALFPEKTR